MTTPKKYSLLKDLRISSEFGSDSAFAGDIYVADGDYYRSESPGTASPLDVFHRSYVERATTLFEPIPDTPERPYPWEPRIKEHFWFVSTSDSLYPVDDGEYEDAPSDGSWHGNVFRTKEDAELRLTVEPLVNAAVKALVNERCAPGATGTHYHVTWSDEGQSFVVFGCVSTHGETFTAGPRYELLESAQAIAEHFNFFLSASA